MEMVCCVLRFWETFLKKHFTGTDNPIDFPAPDPMLEMIVAMRGGIPDNCDFCGQPFNQQRAPIPEEAGEWTCSECWERWEQEERDGRAE